MSDIEDKSKTNTNQDDSTDKTGEKDTKQKFSQEDFDKKLDERMKREREQADKRLADELKKNREDWERQAKLSAEEKEAEEKKTREAETAKREREITLRENRAEARELLVEKGISTDLVGIVVDVDLDKTKENIDALEKSFTKAVEAGVAKRLKGDTPKDKSNNADTETKEVPTVF